MMSYSRGVSSSVRPFLLTLCRSLSSLNGPYVPGSFFVSLLWRTTVRRILALMRAASSLIEKGLVM